MFEVEKTVDDYATKVILLIILLVYFLIILLSDPSVGTVDEELSS